MSFGQTPVISKVFNAPFNFLDDGVIPDPGETFFFLLEDGSKRFLLEDGTSRFLLEVAPELE